VAWDSIDSLRDFSGSCCHPEIVSILLRAIRKGVLWAFRIWRTSAVWGLIPSLALTTRIARSANEPPLFLRFVKAAWPGVSMNRNPGRSNWIPCFWRRGQAHFT